MDEVPAKERVFRSIWMPDHPLATERGWSDTVLPVEHKLWDGGGMPDWLTTISMMRHERLMKKVCPECRGDFRYSDTCVRCDGTGLVDQEDDGCL